MYSFCPHCGESLQQEEIPGQMLICLYCRKEIGFIPVAEKRAPIDKTEELIRGGTAARCLACQQVVEVRNNSALRSFATHFTASGPRKICPGSGKPVAPAPAAPPHAAVAASPPAKKPPAGKDLSAYMTKDVVRVVACKRAGNPTIEELILEYLDKTDRVRLQIDAVREILGPGFRMRDYPAFLQQPQLAIWSHATACVVAKKHPQGGYQSLGATEIARVLADLNQARQSFFDEEKN